MRIAYERVWRHAKEIFSWLLIERAEYARMLPLLLFKAQSVRVLCNKRKEQLGASRFSIQSSFLASAEWVLYNNEL